MTTNALQAYVCGSFSPGSANSCGTRWTAFFQKAEGRDKMIKACIATFEGLGYVFESFGDLSRAAAMGGASALFRSARNVTGLMNIFGGVLNSIPAGVRSLGHILETMGTTSVADIKAAATKPLDKAYTQSQKMLAAAEVTCNLGGALLYTTAFGLSRPLKVLSQFTQLSPAANQIKNSFYMMMFVNHLFAVGGAISNWSRSWITMNHVIKEKQGDGTKLYKEFARRSFSNSVKLVEKVSELALDMGHFGAVIPKPLRAALSLVVGACGLTKIYLNTYEPKEMPVWEI